MLASVLNLKWLTPQEHPAGASLQAATHLATTCDSATRSPGGRRAAHARGSAATGLHDSPVPSLFISVPAARSLKGRDVGVRRRRVRGTGLSVHRARTPSSAPARWWTSSQAGACQGGTPIAARVRMYSTLAVPRPPGNPCDGVSSGGVLPPTG